MQYPVEGKLQLAHPEMCTTRIEPAARKGKVYGDHDHLYRTQMLVIVVLVGEELLRKLLDAFNLSLSRPIHATLELC